MSPQEGEHEVSDSPFEILGDFPKLCWHSENSRCQLELSYWEGFRKAQQAAGPGSFLKSSWLTGDNAQLEAYDGDLLDTLKNLRDWRSYYLYQQEKCNAADDKKSKVFMEIQKLKVAEDWPAVDCPDDTMTRRYDRFQKAEEASMKENRILEWIKSQSSAIITEAIRDLSNDALHLLEVQLRREAVLLEIKLTELCGNPFWKVRPVDTDDRDSRLMQLEENILSSSSILLEWRSVLQKSEASSSPLHHISTSAVSGLSAGANKRWKTMVRHKRIQLQHARSFSTLWHEMSEFWNFTGHIEQFSQFTGTSRRLIRDLAMVKAGELVEKKHTELVHFTEAYEIVKVRVANRLPLYRPTEGSLCGVEGDVPHSNTNKRKRNDDDTIASDDLAADNRTVEEHQTREIRRRNGQTEQKPSVSNPPPDIPTPDTSALQALQPQTTTPAPPSNTSSASSPAFGPPVTTPAPPANASPPSSNDQISPDAGSEGSPIAVKNEKTPSVSPFDGVEGANPTGRRRGKGDGQAGKAVPKEKVSKLKGHHLLFYSILRHPRARGMYANGSKSNRYWGDGSPRPQKQRRNRHHWDDSCKGDDGQGHENSRDIVIRDC